MKALSRDQKRERKKRDRDDKRSKGVIGNAAAEQPSRWAAYAPADGANVDQLIGVLQSLPNLHAAFIDPRGAQNFGRFMASCKSEWVGVPDRQVIAQTNFSDFGDSSRLHTVAEEQLLVICTRPPSTHTARRHDHEITFSDAAATLKKHVAKAAAQKGARLQGSAAWVALLRGESRSANGGDTSDRKPKEL